MGRCPVRSVTPQALEVLKRNQHLLGYVLDRPSLHPWLTFCLISLPLFEYFLFFFFLFFFRFLFSSSSE